MTIQLGLAVLGLAILFLAGRSLLHFIERGGAWGDWHWHDED